MLAVTIVGGCASTSDTGLSTANGITGSTVQSATATPAVATSPVTTAGPEASPPMQSASATNGIRPVAQASMAGTTTSAKTAAYTLTEEEKSLSCKKLTGRMQVRILQLRDWESQTKPSALAQTLQKTVSALWSGDQSSSISDERYVRDRAQLDAFNAELAAKNCKTFNLDEELRPQPVGHTPEPSVDTAR